MRYAILVLLAAGLAMAGSAKLSVETNPPAQLSLDGTAYGKTPKRNLSVSPGVHTISLQSKERGTQTEFQVKVPEGKHTMCSYDFDSGDQKCTDEVLASGKTARGSVELRSNKPAEVYVDGRPVGKTPIERHFLPVGTHYIEFRFEKSEPVRKEVDVRAGVHQKVEVDVTPPGGAGATPTATDAPK